MPTLLGVTTKALRTLRVGESIIVETVNQTRTQRAAGAAAWIIAMNAKQFKGKPHHPEHLFSEDLW